MRLDDLSSVLRIDRLSFPLPWSERSYRYELLDNPSAHLLVAERVQADKRKIVGYIGYWFLIDEVHISTFAVDPDHRRKGIGEKLLVAAFEQAAALGALLVTLEVRVSNQAAIHLYRKYGFEVVGRRANYYRDNHEDAWIMTKEDPASTLPVVDGGEQWVRRKNFRPSPQR